MGGTGLRSTHDALREVLSEATRRLGDGTSFAGRLLDRVEQCDPLFDSDAERPFGPR